jgi:hypothetical protein
MFLHHFREGEAVRLLRDFARVAKRAVVINDLARNLIPYYFTRVAVNLLATSRLTSNDAPVSVLRGFTSDELRSLAEQAGLRKVRVKRAFPYRLLLVADVNRNSDT